MTKQTTRRADEGTIAPARASPPEAGADRTQGGVQARRKLRRGDDRLASAGDAEPKESAELPEDP
jgi:hypothetical protein